MPRPLNLIGHKVGRLTVEAFAGMNPHGKTTWRCRCDCDGKMVVAIGSRLAKGTTRSCGCIRRETTKKLKTTHGKTNTPEFWIWAAMIARCSNPNDARFASYGGRGISVCLRWTGSFQSFMDDMGTRPTVEHSLDRINNDGNYEPTNCKWSTDVEQANNRRKRRWYKKPTEQAENVYSVDKLAA